MSKIKTAEYVSPKHPDKIADQISDAILDAYISRDPFARVAVDVAGGHGTIFIVGEITSKAKNISIENIVKRLAGEVEVIVRIAQQSPEIAAGVDGGGAGDQGIMVGYACSETPEYLPLEFVLARCLNQFLYKRWPHDGKTQITIKNGKIIAIVASFQHAPKLQLEQAISEWLHYEPLAYPDKALIVRANPAGDWKIGGFDADSGMTGRKIVVDSYGPRVPVGGGALSGKDPSKVDRSAAYMARRVAIDYLNKYEAKEVFVYLAYAIGHTQPVQATAIVDGNEHEITDYDLSPNGIIDYLNLRRPIYEKITVNGTLDIPL